MKLDFSRQIFKKQSNTKFHEKPSIGSRVVPCRHDRRTDGRTDITKLIFAFRNFANAHKNGYSFFFYALFFFAFIHAVTTLLLLLFQTTFCQLDTRL